MPKLITVPAILAALLVTGCDNERERAEEVGAAPVAEPGEGPPAEAGASGFEAWDTNRDNRIDRTEYQGGVMRDRWTGWDADEDGIVTEEEFTAGMYRSWDASGDRLIDEQEWESRAKPWLEARGLESGTGYDAWNDDDTDGVSEAELAQGWSERNADVYEEWDADASGGLDENEWGRGWFETWDGNDDGYLGEDEPGYWR